MVGDAEAYLMSIKGPYSAGNATIDTEIGSAHPKRDWRLSLTMMKYVWGGCYRIEYQRRRVRDTTAGNSGASSMMESMG